MVSVFKWKSKVGNLSVEKTHKLMVMYLNRTDTKNEYLMMQACHEFEIFSEGCLLVIISESFV